jgi:hypothetical protein
MKSYGDVEEVCGLVFKKIENGVSRDCCEVVHQGVQVSENLGMLLL